MLLTLPSLDERTLARRRVLRTSRGMARSARARSSSSGTRFSRAAAHPSRPSPSLRAECAKRGTLEPLQQLRQRAARHARRAAHRRGRTRQARTAGVVSRPQAWPMFPLRRFSNETASSDAPPPFCCTPTQREETSLADDRSHPRERDEQGRQTAGSTRPCTQPLSVGAHEGLLQPLVRAVPVNRSRWRRAGDDEADEGEG